MRALAVAGLRRGAMVPTVTTRVEQGFPDLQAATWFAWLAPGATPRPIRGALCAELNAVLAEEEVGHRVAADAIDIEPSASPEAFGTVLAEDRALSTRGPGRESAGELKPERRWPGRHDPPRCRGWRRGALPRPARGPQRHRQCDARRRDDRRAGAGWP
jgi:hypothetical protein